MTRLLVPAVALLGALALGVAVIDGGTPATAKAGTFHVDFDHGDDNNSGRQPGDAWKHAPGDPAATGKAREQALGAGSTIMFAPGVRYRGSIKLAWSGSPEAPITLTGGKGATIDGSDPVASVRPCASADACGNAPNWQALSLVTIGRPLTPFSAFFTDAGPLYEAQNPDPKDFFYSEEPEDLTPTDGNQLQHGMIALDPDTAAAVAAIRDHPAKLLLWVKPNRVVSRPILRTEGTTAYFDPTGLQFYTERPSRYAVIGRSHWIDRPGEYAVLPSNQAIVVKLPAGTRNVSVATGRGGIDLNGQSHVTISNLRFEHMAGDDSRTASGIPISSSLTESRGVTIRGNRLSMIRLPLGEGVINLRKVSMVEIVGNDIDTVMQGSGMRISGPASAILVERNSIRRIGRTGIMLMGVESALVVRNVLTDINGVHGNGVSAYLGNHNVRFIANTITDAMQPATFHGNNGNPPASNDILFANNLLVAPPSALGALISWGKSTRDVRIVRNVIVGGEKLALRLSASDSNVRVSNNVIDGLAISGTKPSSWALTENTFPRLSYQQRGEQLAGNIAQAISRWDHRSTPPPEICAIISRHAITGDTVERKYAKWVGAQQQCP